MRDHPAHGAYIMAGMWGARLDNAEVRRRFLAAFTDMFQVSACIPLSILPCHMSQRTELFVPSVVRFVR